MTGNNNVTMSSRSQSRSTRHQRSTSAIVSKISRGRITQSLKHNHTQFVCNALRVWKPMRIHQGRCNVDQSASSQKPNEQQNSTRTVAAGQETKANAQEHYYSNPTDYEPMHAPRKSFDSTDKAFPNRRINRSWK